MTYSPALILHIAGGMAGLASGLAALLSRKGSPFHRAAGRVFVASMLVMGAFGAYVGFQRAQSVNVLAGIFTCYLVATAWLTVARRARQTGLPEVVLLLLGIATGTLSFMFGWAGATGERSESFAGYFVFAAVVFIFAAFDLRMLLRGGVSGAARIARHLWRMGIALFAAAGSFFLGTASDPVLRQSGLRARLFTPEIRATHLPEVPVLIIVGLTLYWLCRVLFTNQYKSGNVPARSSTQLSVEEEIVRIIVLCVLVVSLLSPAGIALAQDNADPGPLSVHHRHLYGGAQKILLRAAETMPEGKYGFKPVDTVRSFGGIVGHIADAQYTFCSAVLGEKNPRPRIEETKKSKSELIASLKEAFAYCNRAYDGLTDVSGSQTVTFMGGENPKLGVMTVNVVHSIEHYGNLVTYLRMNDLVPPTSQPEFMKELQK
jgi:uncharacterized damage-inducible protein DinB/uncharacterized membrane protein